MENPILKPTLLIRIGLAAVFIYAGIHTLFNYQSWIGFAPGWIQSVLDPKIFLYFHAVFELILGAGMLAGIFLPIFSLAAFFDILAILIFYGVDEITFRDFGLAMTALALFLMSLKKN
ncbi:MAG: DoxX family membrane protein [Patescibacteria group bacterium]